MTNIEKFASALKEWLRPILSEILPNVRIPAQSMFGGIMRNYLGIDPASYNIWEELGTVVLDPTIEQVLRPAMRKLSQVVPDEDVPAAVQSYLDAFRKKTEQDGVVNIFGIQFEQQAFDNFERLFKSKLKTN